MSLRAFGGLISADRRPVNGRTRIRESGEAFTTSTACDHTPQQTEGAGRTRAMVKGSNMRKPRVIGQLIGFSLLFAVASHYLIGILPESGNQADISDYQPEPGSSNLHSRIGALVERTIDVLEEVSERNFTEVPEVKMVGRKELRESLLNEFHWQIENGCQHLLENMTESSLLQLADRLAGELVGKYDYLEGVVYLVPGNAVFHSRATEGESPIPMGFLRGVVTHELIHALQDQVIGISGSIEDIQGPDAMEAFRAALEGHAMFTQELTSSKLRRESSPPHDGEIWPLLGSPSYFQPGDLLTDMKALHIDIVYSRGRTFMEYHYHEGGIEKIWNILAHPPHDTTMILFPDTYSVTGRDIGYQQDVLEGMEIQFGAEAKKLLSSEVPKTYLMASYAKMDPENREEMISQIRYAQVLQVSKGPDSQGNLAVISLRDPAYCPEFLTNLERLAERSVGTLDGSGEYVVGSLRFGNYTKVGDKHSRSVSYYLVPQSGNTLRTSIVRICIDDSILEIMDTNMNLSDEQIMGIYTAARERLERAAVK